MKLRMALAGLGNVGAGVVRLLHAQGSLLKQRGAEIELVAVSARDRNKARDIALGKAEWVDNPRDLASRAVDVVVEVIGGAEGVAYDLAKASLTNGKHFVTANKAMIAAHGTELAAKAEAAKLQLSFEAAVCGGMPVLKLIREGLAANEISSLRGILNGTCNYILTRMHGEGLSFDAALAEAQKLGYAEADPTADIDGHDAANKLAILSALAFGTKPDLESVFVEGIRNIRTEDLQGAGQRGGTIKLMGIAVKTPDGIVQRVQPVFVPGEEALAHIHGAQNAVQISCDSAGDIFLQGAGAGGDATASAIVADLVDIARGHRSPAFGVPADRPA